MKREIPTTYEPKDHEDRTYQAWEKSGFFNPDNIVKATDIHCNILPPPNANGELHLGHASGYAIMDIFGRYQRMQGKKTLLLPGKDHAGIQTQVVFEKKIHAERNISRHDLGREQFIKECYDFCIDRSQYMRSQEKQLGLSADWSREKFTLDPKISRHALETFVRMYREGLIYRGERIINWCPRCSTALSDVEVIHKETEGKLFFLEYPVKNSSEKIIVATTRPETMLGDTAVAVHPDDTRYERLIGKTVILPLIGREIPIIADLRVDKEFGTGAVKITPAHDPLDWEIGKTHALPVIQVINTNAKITEAGAPFQNLSAADARIQILGALERGGFLVKAEPHIVNLSSCERCKTPIEPLVSKQWFVNVDAPQYSLKKETIKALEENQIVFHPENMKSQMIHWLDNLRDWCISRQLWWGHRIPIWYRDEETYCDIEPPKGDGWQQDPDTLDTWFSSGQWPYTTLGYPDEKDAKTFYPTDTMIMGRDLLFFWATRMVMFGLYTTKEAPFKHLYFTGLVRDKEGHKMSKSKGNGIDVLHAIHEVGADAVRLSLTVGTTPGLDFRLYQEKIQTFRNFTNKLWNIGRYVIQQSAISNQQSDEEQEATNKKQEAEKSEGLKITSSADHWILVRLDKTVHEVTRLLESYQFSLAGETLRDFTWNDFADWYVEVHKVEKNTPILRYAFETILKLWHPFMPFVTETLWSRLRKNEENENKESEGKNLLLVAPWPAQNTSYAATNESDLEKRFPPENNAQDFSRIIDLIVKIREIRAVYRIDPKQSIDVSLATEEKTLFSANIPLLKRLARVGSVAFVHDEEKIFGSAHAVVGDIKLSVHLTGVLDVRKEQERLKTEMKNLETFIRNTSARLNNESFISKAPKALVSNTEKLLTDAKQKQDNLRKALNELIEH